MISSLQYCHLYHRFSLRNFVERLTTPFSRCSARKATARAGLCSSQVQSLTLRQKEQISVYVDALLQWNQRMNLTAVTDTEEVMKRHVDDSLAIVPPIQNSYLAHGGSSYDLLNVIDVGSGPGLPGLIFAIAFPGWKVTLLESMHKRCLFLEHVIGRTGLSNVQVVCARAESVGQNVDFREVFDVAVARAVAEMRILAEYCLPLVRVGGLFVAAKGSDPQMGQSPLFQWGRGPKVEEKLAEPLFDCPFGFSIEILGGSSTEEVKSATKAIQLMGASVVQLCSVESDGPHGQRTAVVCLKDHSTPCKYPRHPGVPGKSPL